MKRGKREKKKKKEIELGQIVEQSVCDFSQVDVDL
jgi:hypothetical protein